VLGVDEGGDATAALGVGDGVQGDGGLAGGLRSVDLDDPATRQPADAEGDVEGDGSGGDDGDTRGGFSSPRRITEPLPKFLSIWRGPSRGPSRDPVLQPLRAPYGLGWSSRLRWTLDAATDEKRRRSASVDHPGTASTVRRTAVRTKAPTRRCRSPLITRPSEGRRAGLAARGSAGDHQRRRGQ